MSSPIRPPRAARELAFQVLLDASALDRFPSDLINERLGPSELAPIERRLAFELVHGVVRRQQTLFTIAEHFVSRPWNQVEPPLQWLLALGVYQLAFLTHVPPHAAVNETAELARWIGAPQWTGFVNGVLRGLAGAIQPPAAAPCNDAVALPAGEYRRIKGLHWPDRETDFVGWYSRAFSLRAEMTRRWAAGLSHERLVRLGFWFLAPHGLCLRVNRLRRTVDALQSTLSSAGFNCTRGAHPDAVWVHESPRVDELPGFDAGDFTVQDESAMGAATLLAPRPGECILDLCAAPGGKTTHIAELMDDRGVIVATDINAERLRRVEMACQRLGLKSIETRLIHRDLGDVPAGPFDGVLVDAPCSNTGVLGKRPEARWRFSVAELAELSQMQTRLLQAALAAAGPSGRVVYSTCSLENEENRGVVDRVLSLHPGWKVATDQLFTPGEPADGAYQALLVPINA